MKQYFKIISLSVLALAFIVPAGQVHALPTYEDACETPLLRSSLTVGNQNQDVRDLQNFLAEHNFLADGSVSGYYGPLTRQAVREFQASQNIVSSGTAATTGYGAVGVRTRTAINTIACGDVGGSTGSGTTNQTPTTEQSVVLTADKTNVTSGQAVTLTWRANGNPTSCSTSFDTLTIDSAKQGTKILYPTSPAIYVFTCAYGSGTSASDLKSDSVRISVDGSTTGVIPNGQNEVSITADKASVVSGGPVTLSWNATGAPLSCTTNFGQGDIDYMAPKQGSKTVYPTIAKNYFFTCTYSNTLADNYGRKEASVNVAIGTDVGSGNPTGGNPASGSVDLKVNASNGPITVTPGTPIILSWTTTPTSLECKGSASPAGLYAFGGSGGVLTSGAGSQQIPVVTSTTVYTISCTPVGGGTAVSDSVTVNVDSTSNGGGTSNGFSTNIVAGGTKTPTAIASGAPILLSWSISPSSTFVSSCTGSGSGVGKSGIDAMLWNGGKTTTGSMTATPLTTTTYTISCTANGVTKTDSVTVPVVTGSTGTGTTGTGPAITSFTATPGKVFGAGIGLYQEWTLAWTSANSAYCYGQDGTSSQWLSQWPTSGSVTVNVFADGVFTLKCTSGSGLYAPTDTKTVSIIVDRSTQPGPAVTFTASSNTATVNSPFTLTWSSPTATSCTGGGDGSFSLYVNGTSGSKAITFYSPGTFTMTITCKSANNGYTTRTQTVVVTPSSGTSTGTVTPPTSGNALGIDIEANGSDGPVTVSAGQSLTIKWGMSNNALIFRTVCVVSGDSNFTGNRNPVGSFTITASASATYTISCQDNGQGPVSSDSVSVNVGPANAAPSAVLSTNSTSVVSGGSTTLTWSATNANICLLTGGNLNVTNNSIQGIVSTGPLTQTTTYSLSCYKNVPNSNNYLVPVYAPTQTITVSVAASGGTGTGGSGTSSSNGSDVTIDLRANNTKGSITTTANSGAASLSWQMNSANSTSLIGWTCSVSGVPGISSVVPGGQTLFVRPSVTTTYGISCTSYLTNQSVSDSVTINVQ